MDIHNLMEDLVVTTVNELFDAEEKGSSGSWCTCGQCRMDVACYVLNRVRPEYVQSGRGVAYAEQDYGEKLQRVADVVSLVKEGWSKINATPRPNHSRGTVANQALPRGPVFNIKPIMGRLFNGSNFEPIVDAKVSLSDDEGLVRMMDGNWQNPYLLVRNTAGTFIFWPYPVPCGTAGEKRRFSFTIEAEPEGYEAFSHHIEIDAVAEPEAVGQFSMQSVHKLQDLYVFAK